MSREPVRRSFVIPILDFSPHSPYNILTLLDDFKQIPGEVICIFNSPDVFEQLRTHERIDKFCFNSLNAGVSRSWNMGINLAEGDAVYILNSDLHIKPTAVDQLETYLFSLPRAVIIGPQGSHVDFKNFRVLRYYQKGNFHEPTRTHDVSGFLFCIHRRRFLENQLMFDVRFSPCFCEEWDMALQVIEKNLACYAVPVTDFDHHWGVSGTNENSKINYFGRDVYRNDILQENRQKFVQKWYPPQGAMS